MSDESPGYVPETQLSPEQFYRHDPLLVLVRDKLHIGAGWGSELPV
jgi:hypothetical protein